MSPAGSARRSTVGGSRRTTSRRPPAAGACVVPTLRVERRMLRESGHTSLAAVDEVGRGALGGPVTVGVVVVDLQVGSAPKGLRDSKLLTPEARARLAPRLRRWAPAWAVGHASAEEIDSVGILRALRLAGERALAALPVQPSLVLLDGSYDWLTRPEEPPTLFDLVSTPRPSGLLEVTTMVKADLRCASVAAASVLAKTTRDAIMVDLARDHPGYCWEANKGYASPDHMEALRSLGPCEQHRRSWNLKALAMREDGLVAVDDPDDDDVDVLDLPLVEGREPAPASYDPSYDGRPAHRDRGGRAL